MKAEQPKEIATPIEVVKQSVEQIEQPKEFAPSIEVDYQTVEEAF